MGDSYASIEAVLGSNFADQLVGDAGANDLRGMGGDDRLIGGDGNDTLNGGPGGDVLDGGNGFDFASYATAASHVDVNFANPAANSGEAFGDTYVSIEGVIGSNFADQLVGDANANELRGMGGDDRLVGGDGNDTLNGGPGADFLDGGNGFDFASYETAPAHVDVNLANPAANSGEAFGDSYASIEGVIGSNFADQLVGDANGNELRGMGGDDRLVGGEGNDTLNGGPGADVLDGGNGFDFASYETAASHVDVNLAAPAANSGEAFGDSYVSIEGVIGSNFADQLVGDASANELRGLAGNDFLFGQDGNDVLNGGPGGDALDGGNGFDFATYETATSHVDVNLANPAANAGEAYGDTYASIEGVIGSNFADQLVGDANGNDLRGLDGDDRVIGGDGNDVLNGGPGADALDGGNGFDFATYEMAASHVDVNLANPAANAGEAYGDTYASIEGVIGSNFADQLVGDANGNDLRGLDGDDRVIGGLGSDLIIGGHGNDMLTGGGTGTDGDHFRFMSGDGNDAITDFHPTGTNDVVEVDHTLASSFADVMAHAAYNGVDTVITFDAVTSITLQHIAKDSLISADFAFV